MKIKHLKKHFFDNSSALSDLAFLLIIYFIVIAGFNVNMGFLINLPSEDSVRSMLREDLILFEMDGNGNILYEGEAIDIYNAKILIQTAKRYNPNIALKITIDGKAQWQNIVSFVELAQDVEIDSFYFSMKKDEL